jgi:hypothetical protein
MLEKPGGTHSSHVGHSRNLICGLCPLFRRSATGMASDRRSEEICLTEVVQVTMVINWVIPSLGLRSSREKGRKPRPRSLF